MRLLLLIIAFGCISFSGCTGCSHTNTRTQKKNSIVKVNENAKRDDKSDTHHKKDRSKTVVKMTRDDGGVYKIPVEINGTEMYFIFDTGAGMISISTTEANFLYKQGKLSNK